MIVARHFDSPFVLGVVKNFWFFVCSCSISFVVMLGGVWFRL